MRLLLALLLVPATALAAPFVVSDPVDPSVTHCGVFLDSAAKQTIPVTVQGANKICQFDLSATLASGQHTVRMTSIVVDPIFGSLESPQSLPLAFAKPAVPSIPAGLKLAP